MTISKGRRERFYHVLFKLNGRQVNRSTGCENLAAAKVRAKEIFAECVRGPKEAASIASLSAQLEEMKSMIVRIMENAASPSTGRPGRSSAKVNLTVTIQEAYDAFVEYRDGQKATGDHEIRLRRRLRAFLSFVGGTTPLGSITPDHIKKWTQARANVTKTIKHEVAAVAQLWKWCADMHGWCDPAVPKRVPIPRISSTVNVVERELPTTVPIEKCREIMAWVENNAPDHALFYALSLFSGVRANKKKHETDTVSGEILRLFQAVTANGWDQYLLPEMLRIPAGKVKGKPRQVFCPPNVRAYIEAYQDRVKAPLQKWHQAEIIERFRISHNSFRHSAVSAYVSVHGEARAAIYFGTDVRTLQNHYINLMARKDAEQFYEIYPLKRSEKAA